MHCGRPTAIACRITRHRKIVYQRIKPHVDLHIGKDVLDVHHVYCHSLINPLGPIVHMCTVDICDDATDALYRITLQCAYL